MFPKVKRPLFRVQTERIPLPTIHQTNLLINLGYILEIECSRLLQALQRLVQKKLEVLERVLAHLVFIERPTDFEAQIIHRLVVVVDSTFHQHRLVRLARAYLKAFQFEQVLEDFAFHVVAEMEFKLRRFEVW